MTPIVWLKNATRNIQTIHAYYTGEGVPEQAKRIIRLIERTAKQLMQCPGLGYPGRVPNTRELLVSKTPYLIVYRETDSQVQILRVLHTAQKWPRVE